MLLAQGTAAAAALAALLTAAAPPAVAADGPPAAAGTAGSPARWVPDGTPVHGTTTAAGAPLLTAGGDYRDRLAKGEVLYYAVRLPAEGTAAAPATQYLSAFAVPAAGSHVGFLDGLTLRLTARDGTLCDSADPRFGGQDAAEPIGGVVRRPGISGSVCRDAGTYVLSVERDSAATSSGDVWPLDLAFTAEPALATAPDGGTDPVPTYAPASAAPPSGAGRAVRGAPGMDGTGVRLPGTGVYRDRLLPGETLFYRVPVGWGQRLLASAAFGAARVTAPGGFTADGLDVEIYSPVRGPVGGETLSYSGQAAVLSAQTPRVLYDNRLSSDARVGSAAVAGYYYLAVGLHPGVAAWSSGGVGVTLRLRVAGTAQAAPDYAGDPAAAGLAVPGAPGPAQGGSGGGSGPAGPSGASGSSGGLAPSAGGPRADGTSRRPLAFGAFALAAVFTAWPTALLWRRRRAGGR